MTMGHQALDPIVDTARLRYNYRMNMIRPTGNQLKIVRIGNSAGVILPKELLDRLHVEVGDALSVSQTPEGITLTAEDAEFDHQMAEARKIMKRYRKALSELAK